MDLQSPPPDFRFVLFERVEPETNIYRYYYLAYGPTLYGPAVIRMWGRKGESSHTAWQPFPTLDDAWPDLRRHIRTRLRHGYQVVQPAEYAIWCNRPDGEV